MRNGHSRNLKTALALFSIALAFFAGVILRHWYFS
ncbi:MAG TPA: cytochrome oxidase small assembly protein [Burkholderiales bacterium]|nr:cytochrome oxidase small assembly protein [Burkholderiales bacterium]